MPYNHGDKPDKYETTVTLDSWGEFIDYVSQPFPIDVYDTSSQRQGHAEWAGTSTFDAALTLGIAGWEEGVKRARAISDNLISRVGSMIETLVMQYDVEGIAFDMDLVNRGEHECWYHFDKVMREGEGQVFKIVVNLWASSGVSAESMTKRGALLVALIELMELAGRKVEVKAVYPASRAISIEVMIKTAQTPLDMPRLMFACAHPAMFRRLMFRALEQNPKEHAKTGFGYGTQNVYPENLRGDFYVEEMFFRNRAWQDNPEAYLVEVLQKQGIDIRLDGMTKH